VNTWKFKQVQILTHCSYDYEVPRTFSTLHLTLPLSHKSFNLVKEWVGYGVFGVRGFSVWNPKPHLPHLSHVCLFIYNNIFYHIIKTILSHNHNMFKKIFEPSPLCPHSKAITRSNPHFMTQLGWGVHVGKKISMVKKFM
jgi:hypothetical protein